MDNKTDFINYYFDDDEWNSRLPVTGGNGYDEKQKSDKKIIIIAVSVALVVMILLFLFFSFILGADSDNSSASFTEPSTSIRERRFYFAEGEDDFEEGDIEPVPVSLSADGFSEFTDYINGIDVIYDYSSFYNIPEALSHLKQSVNSSVKRHSKDIRVNGKPDVDVFFEIIKRNNSSYVRGNYFFEEFPDWELYDICADILEATQAYLDADSSLDADMLYCCLYDFKILIVTGSLDYGMITTDNVLFINKERIESDSFAIKSEDPYKSTLYHEVMHIFQKKCADCYNAGEYRVGLSHNYANLEMNSLSCLWLVEASAEMNMSDFLSIPYTTYSENIAYIETLNFVSSLGDYFKVGQTQDLSFTQDLDSLYEQLGMSSADEKEEVTKMMFTLELLLNGSDNFDRKYEAAYGVSPSDNEDVKENLKISLKEDVMLTLTKIFYRNLASKVNAGSVALQDVCYLIRLFEADIQSHLKNDNYGKMVAYGEFFDSYTDIQNEFFRLIAQNSGINTEDIHDSFASYSMNIISGETEKSPNCYLEFLNDDITEWYQEFCKEIYRKGYYSIAECGEKASECAIQIENAE